MLTAHPTFILTGKVIQKPGVLGSAGDKEAPCSHLKGMKGCKSQGLFVPLTHIESKELSLLLLTREEESK